ncbi:olfactory receptor 14A16-like [Anser cygnoides]|uniref:olfactory receptor 14A16-like n=1 Tax=Anser cygnoides TaxID=8845 RepID=UPI0034D2FC95
MPDTIEGHSLLSTWHRLPQGRKLSPTICRGLIQSALEEEEAPEHLQYIDGIIAWGDTAEEVFEKGKKILQIPLKADFALKEMKVKGRAQEILLQAGQAAEYSVLTLMSYDRYAAICKPLHYRSLVGSRACVQMAAAAWGSGFLTAVLHTATTFSLPLCQGNELDQFFCELPQILKLSCSDSFLREVGLIVVGVCLVFACFVFIAVSYVQIFRAVLKVPSEQGRHKAFSTCLPHLAMVSLFISTGMFAYLKPPSISSPSLDLVVAVLYSLVPAAMNPLIYSMRNKELKDALRKLFGYMHLIKS